MHTNGEHLEKRIFFPWKMALNLQILKSNLMLVLNKTLQKAEEGN